MTTIIFPDIEYSYWLSEWTRSIGELPIYSNKNMVGYIVFNGDINSCTSEILTLVKSQDISKPTVLRIIDLIYSWGGKSGRMFYASVNGKVSPRQSLDQRDSIFNKYLQGVMLAKQGDSRSIKKFCEVDGIGLSYASKHAYFWSLDSKKPLIIVDSKIAGSLGYSTIQSLEKVHKYRDIVFAFRNKSLEEFNEDNPSKVERALFAFHNHYFLNDNNGWKNKGESKDFTEASTLANKLFDNEAITNQ